MAITPSSHLKLLKCEIEIDNKNQLTFANATAQYNYFNGLNKLEVDNFTYLRKDSVIRYNAHIDSIIQYNYVMYQNTNYSNKWFYAFITKMEYVSDSVTFIYIKEDPFQTWQFDLTYKRCFVEREHVNSDLIGEHLLDEGLELSEFVINGTPQDIENMKQCVIGLAVAATPDTDSSIAYLPGKLVGNLYTGLTYEAYAPTSDGKTLLKDRLDTYYQNGTAERILGLLMIPKVLTPWDGSTSSWAGVIGDSWSTINQTITRNTTINGYTPKNNKLFTYPYTYILADNNAGINNIYRFENFVSPNSPSFVVDIMAGFGCSGICAPVGYKGTGVNPNWNESFPTGKYAVCSWVGDAYTNYMSQQSLNMWVNTATAIGEIAIGGVAVATGAGSLAGASLIASGAGSVLETIKQRHDAKFIPPTVQNNSSAADIFQAMSRNTITFYCMSIKQETAKVIDNYFSMYGYKVDLLKVPNITGRSNWNYVKTIDANIEGYIPQESLQEIKDMFNTGVTFWHTTQYFLDYSRNNTIV